jgi:hypothetical protein
MAGVLALMAANASAGQITLYEGPSFRGSSMSTNDTLPNTERSVFRDVASSVVVADGTWEVCTDAYFRGRCAQLTPGNYARLSRQLNGSVASVREVNYEPEPVRVIINPDMQPAPIYSDRQIVTTAPIVDAAPVGPRVILYEHTPRGTRAVDLASNVEDLESRGFENRADAAFISGGVWRLCDGRLGRGQCADFSPGHYETLGTLDGRVKSAYLIGAVTDRVASAPPVPGGRAVLYQYPNFAGLAAVVDYDRAPDLDWANFTTPASSLRIESGTWLVCSNIGYQGECQVLEPGNYPILDKGIYSARQVWRPEYGSVDRYRIRWQP